MVLVANTLPPMLVKRSERPNIVTNRMKESLRFFVVCKLFKTCERSSKSWLCFVLFQCRIQEVLQKEVKILKINLSIFLA